MAYQYQKTLIIFNATAGLATREDIERLVCDRLKIMSQKLDLFYLNSDFEKNIASYDFFGVDLVVAVGGDGTVKVATRTILANRLTAPLAIVPVGSANVIAITLGLPLTVKGALEVITGRNSIRPVDVGLINGRYYFLVGFSVGYISKIVTGTSQELKKRLGFLGYVLRFLFNKIKIKKIRFRVQTNNQVFWVKGNSLIIFNALNYFGLKIKRPIAIDDGVLNLFILTNKTFLSLVAAFFHLLWYRQPKRYVFYLDNKQFRISFDKGERSCQIDGDYIDLGQDVDIRILPKAISVITR